MGQTVRQEKVWKDCEHAGEQQVILNLATGGIWRQPQSEWHQHAKTWLLTQGWKRARTTEKGKSSGVVFRTGGDGLHASCAHFDFDRPLRTERSDHVRSGFRRGLLDLQQALANGEVMRHRSYA
jgi:hypothetical protein